MHPPPKRCHRCQVGGRAASVAILGRRKEALDLPQPARVRYLRCAMEGTTVKREPGAGRLFRARCSGRQHQAL